MTELISWIIGGLLIGTVLVAGTWVIILIVREHAKYQRIRKENDATFKEIIDSLSRMCDSLKSHHK